MKIMSATDNLEFAKHNIFDEDPGDLIQYVYKEVEVITLNGVSHQGWVYTIDPVSLSLGLIRFSQGRVSQIELIMGHAVKEIQVLNENTDTYKDQLDSIFKSSALPNLSSNEVASRRDRIVSWLVKNRIPVQVCSDQPGLLSIGDVLYIHPPYLPENCQSSNEIVLGKIQGLLKNMPDILITDNLSDTM